MDGNLAPIHRKKRKCIWFDLYGAAITIFSIEIAVFSSWVVYVAIMLGSFYENGRKTTKDFMSEESGVKVEPRVIPHDVMYFVLLLGYGYSAILTVFLILGTFWLFTEFLNLWIRANMVGFIALCLILILDWAMIRREFPMELLYFPFRIYFFFVIRAFVQQIVNDEKRSYDPKKYAEEHFRERGLKFVSLYPEPTRRIYKICCAILQCGTYWPANIIVAPTDSPNEETIMRNMERDIEEYPDSPKLYEVYLEAVNNLRTSSSVHGKEEHSAARIPKILLTDSSK